MGKAPRRAGEARRERDDGAARVRGGLVFEGGPDDRLHAADLDELEGQGARAGGVDAGGPVALGQPQELLRLAEAGPREGPAEQDGHELADGGADLGGAADARIGRAHGVGRLLRGVVGVVRRPPARRLRRMDFDQLAVEIDPDQARVAADVDLGADVAGRDGVEGPLELDVVIGVDGALGPGGRIEGLGPQRQERGLLLGLEHDARGAARGAVEAGAGQVAAPGHGAGLHVVEIAEDLAPEEILADIRDPALDLGFSGRVPRHGRVDEEAAVLGVLEEDPVDLGRVAIGARDDGLEIVDHEPAHHALKEGPRRLQPREDRRQVLAEGDPQEGVPTEGQRDEEPVDVPVRTGGGIRPQAQPPEVGFGGLAGRRIGHPHGHARRAEAAVGLGEPVERAIRDAEALLAEPAVDLGQAQAVGQPGRDLRLIGREPLRERGGPPHGRPPQPAHERRELLVGRRRGAAGQAHRDGRRHVLGDRLPIDAGASGDGAHAVAGAVPAPDFPQFDHTQLPIGHGHLPRGRRPRPGSGPGPGGGGKVLRNPWGKGFENQPVSWGKPSGKSHESPSMNRVGQVGRSPSSSPSRGQGIQALRTRRTCFARTPLMSDW